MSELATLARPYAEAAFKQAKENGSSDQWSETLSFLALAMSNPSLAWASVNPKVGKAKLESLILDICSGHIDKYGENFIKLLIRNNRLDLAEHVQQLYEMFKAEDQGYLDVSVRTAMALSKTDQDQLAEALEKTLNKKVRLEVEQDKKLIGGVVIKAGDKVIDGSVRGRLQQLAKKLSS